MKTKSPFRNKSYSKEIKISERFNRKTINKIAIQSGYKKRSCGKINAKSLVIGFMMMLSKKKNTYDSWAQEVSLNIGITVSKQAVEERMSAETTLLTKMLLEEEFNKQLKTRTLLKGRDSELFNSIKVEDSTTLNLPEELSFAFPGNVSKGKKKSLIKVHAMYDFKENTFDFLDLHDFSKNDQSLASHALAYLQKKDLLLRDMGFLVLDVLEQLNTKGVYFISRKKAHIKVYDTETNQEINLLKVLRKKGYYDKEVSVGKKKMIKMRLVIVPVPPQQAAQRRRKAKQDRDKRLNHSKDYYELLGYSIILTNITESLCSAEMIKKLYELRWQIEIIFKSWKSCFSMEKLIPTKCKNPERIYCMIYLFLLFILLFQVVWSNNNRLKLKQEIKFSIIKMARFFLDNFFLIFKCENERMLQDLIISKCIYDKRNDRFNLTQKYEQIAA